VARIVHTSISIEYALRLSDEELIHAVRGTEDELLSAAELRARVQDLKAIGFWAVPGCDNHDDRGFCRGHQSRSRYSEQPSEESEAACA
jgi:hypothetical protein